MNRKTLLSFLAMTTLTLQRSGSTPVTVAPSTPEQNTTETTSIKDTLSTGTMPAEDNTAAPSIPAPTTEPTSAQPAQPTKPVTTTPTPAQPVGLNGTFHLTSTYKVPSGTEPLDATVTIKNDVITAVSAKNVAENDKSIYFQDKFISGIA